MVTRVTLLFGAAAVYLIASVVCFSLYGVDKAWAKAGKRRVPEKTLHLVSLAFGWPGGFVGQRVFHHKTRKIGFQIVFWCTVLAHLIAWVGAWLLLG